MATAGFIDASSRIAALQNAASQPAPGSAAGAIVNPNPAGAATGSVGQYQNQQLGGLVSKTSPTTGPSNPSQTPGQVQAPSQGYNQSPTASIANATLQSVQASQQRINDLYQVAANKKAQRLAASSGGSSASAGQQTQGGGINYGANPNLSAARNQALKTAFSYVGDPYVLGGTSHQGIDCSGLVMAVYDQFGFGGSVDSHNARIQGGSIPGVRTSVSNLQPGDIVAWTDGSHIAIYAGNGMIVSAADYGEGVKYQPVWGSVVGIHIRLPGE